MAQMGNPSPAAFAELPRTTHKRGESFCSAGHLSRAYFCVQAARKPWADHGFRILAGRAAVKKEASKEGFDSGLCSRRHWFGLRPLLKRNMQMVCENKARLDISIRRYQTFLRRFFAHTRRGN